MADIKITVQIDDLGSSIEFSESVKSGNSLWHATEVEKLSKKIFDRVVAVYGDIQSKDVK